MALAIDATVGGEDSNSYVTLSEAETYFESKFYGSDWTSLSDDNKNITLVESTRMIDYLYVFNGTITNTDPRQALSFPRTSVRDCEGILIDSDIIPEQVKNATYEQALYIAQNNPTETTNNEFTKASVGKGAVSVEFKNGYTINQISNAVSDYLRCLGSKVASAQSGGLSNSIVLRA